MALPHVHHRWPHITFWLGIAIILVVWLLFSRPGRLVLNSGTSLVVMADEISADKGIHYDRIEFENFFSDLNSKISLPHKIYYEIQVCDDPNAYYDPEIRTVVICNELIDDFQSTLSSIYSDPDELRVSTTNALIFITLHETGHALIEMLDLPFVGREEDVSDQLALYLLLHNKIDGGYRVLDAATWFGLTSETYHIEESDFSAEHSLDAQRYYNLACWVYGSNTVLYKDVIQDGGLTPERALLCEEEYQRIEHGWGKLLQHYYAG